MRKGESKRDGEGGRRPFDLLLMGFIVEPELQPSWPTRAAATVAASEPPSSVTQATKTKTSAVSMKLYRQSANSKSISKCPAFGSNGKKLGQLTKCEA